MCSLPYPEQSMNEMFTCATNSTDFSMNESGQSQAEQISYLTFLFILDFVRTPLVKFFTILPFLCLIYYYIHRGGPYLVRGSAILCGGSIVLQLLWLVVRMSWSGSHQIEWMVSSANLLLFSLMTGVLTVLSLISRWWWCGKLNYVKDLSHIGGGNGRRRMNLGAIPPVFPNGWIPIMEASDLRVADVQSISALGKNLAVFRGENRKVYVLDAFCPHLGANLAVGGRVNDNCLECPFHGWRFSGESGKCVHIPYAKKIPEVAKTECWTSCEVNGFIYVWHHAEGEPPDWEVPVIPEIESGQWVYRNRTEHKVLCHIQEIPENGADIHHLHQLHSASIFCGSDISNLLDRWTFMKHTWEPQWEPSSEYQHIANISLQQHIKIFNWRIPFTSVKLTINQIGPALVHLYLDSPYFGRGVYLQHIISQGPLEHKIIHHFYSNPFFTQGLANIFSRGEAVMLERDIMIWNNKKFIRNPILVKEDKLLNRYRRWYLQFYSENSPTLKMIRERELLW